MKSFEFEAIGTHWYIEIYDDLDSNDLETLKEKVIEYCSEFEHKYSRFKEHSLISKLNKEKVFSHPSQEFFDLLTLGSDAKELTDGHFDIAVGTVLENMGYDKNYSFESKDRKVEKELKFNKDIVEISTNTRVDLGGIGKGFLIDRIADLLRESLNFFFINAGGDIFATSNFEDPIEFALENPFELDEMIGSIFIKDKALASSSGNRRKWKDQKTGKESHHLVDMKSNENVNTISGVFVEGPSATNADIASTCLFVSTKDLYEKISKFYNIEYLVVYSDKSFIKSENYSGKLLNN